MTGHLGQALNIILCYVTGQLGQAPDAVKDSLPTKVRASEEEGATADAEEDVTEMQARLEALRS